MKRLIGSTPSSSSVLLFFMNHLWTGDSGSAFIASSLRTSGHRRHNILLQGRNNGKFDELTSASRFPLFPRTLSAVSFEAARAVCKAEDEQARRLIVAMQLPNSSPRRRPDSVVQRLDTASMFEDGGDTSSDWVANNDEESPALLLAIFKLAVELAASGRPRVRFVCQNVQTAMRLQKIIHYHERASGGGDPSRRRHMSSLFRLSVLGMNSTSGRLHFGLAMDDEVVLVVAPSTERPAQCRHPTDGDDCSGALGVSVLSALDDLIAAASNSKIARHQGSKASTAKATPKTVVLVNPQLVRRSRFGASSPYLLAGFRTAYFVDPCYATAAMAPDTTAVDKLRRLRRQRSIERCGQQSPQLQERDEAVRAGRVDDVGGGLDETRAGAEICDALHAVSRGSGACSSCGLLFRWGGEWELYYCEAPAKAAHQENSLAVYPSQDIGAYIFLESTKERPSKSTVASRFNDPPPLSERRALALKETNIRDAVAATKKEVPLWRAATKAQNYTRPSSSRADTHG